MFEFAFVQALFELAYARPQFDPLFELPPNSHSLATDMPTTMKVDFNKRFKNRNSFKERYCLTNVNCVF